MSQCSYKRCLFLPTFLLISALWSLCNRDVFVEFDFDTLLWFLVCDCCLVSTHWVCLNVWPTLQAFMSHYGRFFACFRNFSMWFMQWHVTNSVQFKYQTNLAARLYEQWQEIELCMKPAGFGASKYCAHTSFTVTAIHRTVTHLFTELMQKSILAAAGFER